MEWIGIKDRLPDQDGEYLVTIMLRKWTGNNYEPIPTVIVASFANSLADNCENINKDNDHPGFYDYDRMYEDYEELEDVTHWMPLPEPAED